MHQRAVLGDERAGDDLIRPVDLERPVLDQGIEEILQVPGIERRGIAGKPAGEIEIAHDRDTLVHHDLARLRQRAVAAALDREIDDHRARLHRLDHLLRDQHRRRPAGDEGRGDDDVLALDVLGDERRLLGLVLGRQFPRIAAGGRRIRHIGEDEFGAEALHLLFRRLAHVGRRDDGAEPARRGDGLEAGDADAHDEHLGRRHGARRRHHHREGAAELRRGIDHRLVAGEIGLRGQHVHRLRAGDARHQFHGEEGQPLLLNVIVVSS